MPETDQPPCLRCGGSRVVPGCIAESTFGLRERRRGFLHHMGILLGAVVPWIALDRDAWICLDCATCWSSVKNLSAAARAIRAHGTDELIGRVLATKVASADADLAGW